MDCYKKLPLSCVRPVVVVGKIIIDEYQSPQDDEAIISIGGGGPQAAWGAAAALEVLTTSDSTVHSDEEIYDEQQQHPQHHKAGPQKMPVIFLGPVGDLDWIAREDAALLELVGSAVACVQLVRGPQLRTPRIRLWHDENETIQWHPLYDSFGDGGARKLWNHRPSACDIRAALQKVDLDNEQPSVICHAIMEAGADSPGEGNDAAAFWDPQLQKRIHFLGIEPVAFPEADTGCISSPNAQSCLDRLERFGSVLNVVSPDDTLFRALLGVESCSTPQLRNWEFAIRNGPQGSRIMPAVGDDFNDNNNGILIPPAALETMDGKPVNPTGAGNAYAAAYTTCRGNGLSCLQAASIASAIGAVMCEHHHIPPWNDDILARIRRAYHEIVTKTHAKGFLGNPSLA